MYVVQAPLLARCGDLGEAERLGRAAVEVFEQTDSPALKATGNRALAADRTRAKLAEPGQGNP